MRDRRASGTALAAGIGADGVALAASMAHDGGEAGSGFVVRAEQPQLGE